ncbi:CopZ family metallochaperone [Holophaga foetida]|uniref:CopZ family metallochaperone n=1 Tax=Holophaga foetida TaxID=35839 RepID=UPI00024732DD|nr:cation transporter [Holophaga foetida]
MIRLKIEGMTCGHCVQHVKTALLGVPGVQAAEVDLKSRSAQVTGLADPSALIAAVEEEGYQASQETL